MLNIEQIDALNKKQTLYLQLVKSHQDKDGFILTAECDSLLFSSLLATSPEIRIDITAARNADGQWLRRPLIYPECLACGGSASTISRDQFWGLLSTIWASKRLDIALQLYYYGRKHNWIMGAGLLNPTIFMPDMIALLAEMIYKMGGPNLWGGRSLAALPCMFTVLNVGYAAHLDMLQILLTSEVSGKAPKKSGFIRRAWQRLIKKLNTYTPYLVAKYAPNQLLNLTSIELGVDSLSFYLPMDLVIAQYQRQPNNPLFSYIYHKYTDKDQSETVKLLMNEKWWPADRLPTTTDRLEEYLPQRDFGPDWLPAPPPVITHTGADFIWIANLILKDIK